MKKHITLSAYLFLALLTMAETEAFAQTQYVVESINNGTRSIYVRAGPREIAIGTLYSGSGFRKQQTSSQDSRYWWGRAGGNAQLCGWIDSSFLTPGGSTNITCGGSGVDAYGIPVRDWLLANLAKRINDYFATKPGNGTWLKSDGEGTNATANFYLYGNYDGTSFHNQYSTLFPDDKFVLWRWIHKSGEAVMVRLTNDGESVWGFMRRDKLRTYLPYADGIFRDD